MRVLVTGGLGVIGSQIAREYLDAGHEVTIIDACEAKRNEWTRDQYFKPEWIYEDRIERNALLIRNLVHSCDAVVHAAASTGIPHSAEHPDDDWASNAEATRVLLEALREHPRPTVILSSVKPYRIPNAERLQRWGGLDEDSPLDPDEPYAASKAAQSLLAQAYARSYDLPVVTLRCSNLYGPAPCHGPRHGWLTWFAISAAIGRPLEVQGTGEQARDMLYASDVTAACRVALANARTLAGKIFVIGGGAPNVITVNIAAEQLQALSGCAVLRDRPGRRHEDQLVFVDHSAFTTATGWTPEVWVNEGLARVYAWAKENADELRRVYEGV